MTGILSYGIYVPAWRIARETIATAGGIFSAGGERSVAGWDEDSVTMAVEAGFNCIGDMDPGEIDAVYFATVTPPFREKQSSAFIAAALDLKNTARTYDITDTLRSSTQALQAAWNDVKSGTARKVLVVAADCRPAAPRSQEEQFYGDGAAAILLGEGAVIATIDGFATAANALPGVWRRETDRYPSSFDARFNKKCGFLQDVPTAISSLLSAAGLTVGNASKFVISVPDPAGTLEIARLLKLDMATQLEDLLFSQVGLTGSPHCLLLLSRALGKSKEGQYIVCANYGDGCDAVLIKTIAAADTITESGAGIINKKKLVRSYGRFSAIKEAAEPGSLRKQGNPSIVKYWRDQKWGLRRYGMRCNNCGTLQYPISICCLKCGAMDNHVDVRLSRRGKVFSYTHDLLLGPGCTESDGINPCTRAIVDLDDGCRIFIEMTDNVPEEVDIDVPVELSLRLLHEKGDFAVYGWRAKPDK